MDKKLKDLLEYCRQDSRVCPNDWAGLYDLLIHYHEIQPQTEKPLPPLILAAWGYTSDSEKMIRLKQQIIWASKYGCLDYVYDFLMAIPNENWHHTYD
jgi:hypothetical protein